MNKRSIGTIYENLACEYLVKQGYNIIECNFRCRMGEIDIIAWDGRYLVFIEVKYRGKEYYGKAVYAVSPKKQQVISRVAAFYLMKKRFPESTPCRFDVVTIDGTRLQLYRNAFDYCG